MKKIFVFTIAAIFALALTGCAGASNTASSRSDASDVSTSEAAAEASSEASEASVGIANPWSDVETAQAAAEAAGFDSFTVPETYTIRDLPFTATRYSCMKDLAEAYYEGGASELLIRKGHGMTEDEVHGDYTEYSSTWADTVDGISVTCRGLEPEIANLITWTNGDYVYSAMVHGLGGENFGVPADEIANLIGAVS